MILITLFSRQLILSQKVKQNYDQNNFVIISALNLHSFYDLMFFQVQKLIHSTNSDEILLKTSQRKSIFTCTDSAFQFINAFFSVNKVFSDLKFLDFSVPNSFSSCISIAFYSTINRISVMHKEGTFHTFCNSIITAPLKIFL